MKKKRMRKVLFLLLVFILAIPFALQPVFAADKKVKNPPAVESRIHDILEINGNKYRDLNGNGELDSYEDWRLPVEERVDDLISKMTLEEKAGLMFISSHYSADRASCTEYNEQYDKLCESDVWSKTNNWAQPGDPNYEFDEPVLDASGTSEGILDRNLRHFILRENPPADELAGWLNQIQEVAESSRLGIPAVITSNPRNHINDNLAFGFSESSGVFSAWPGELGLAASRDTKMVKEFAENAAKEWRATGIHKGYMYMADVITDPLWGRTSGTFGEHPDLAADMIYAVVKGYQGDNLSKNSVSLTTKHFPGGGARDDGKDPHYLNGNFNPYPTEGSLEKYHIPPFLAAIEAGTASIMPYYAYPSNEFSVDQGLPWYSETEQFEEVGFAYNRALITDYLRGELGFKGYINTDTGITTSMPWGVEDLTREERIAYGINAGVDIFSGEADPTYLINAVNNGLVEEASVNVSINRLLTEMMQLGLFEDPYVDPKKASKVVNDKKTQKKVDQAHRQSVVLLRNDDNLLPLENKEIKDVKLYVEVFAANNSENITNGLKKTIREYDKSIKITDNIDEATHAFVWVRPSTSTASPKIKVGPETGIHDIDRINAIQDAVPTILAINMTSPWLIEDIEPNAAAVLSTFNVKPEAVVDVIRGKYNPTGKMPFTIPANMEAVENEAGDVPGYDEDPSYVYVNKHGDAYGYDFGLSYEKGKGKPGKPKQAAN
ncbi:beta-glucosidase [Oceanobacillus arenosus]|uniref:beta-glucosidase n=1 Tax=Oceanobacillus arenosus TaxID=1229153 RepID=A0A3D8Q1B8_9BACI|nr:glycoside hydrolase family 3 N-terminal domain-containing protein [Oceanobacillus arenosus]RDW21398.1 beta-glucosidase [Oceanobacillus arenosus]